MAKLGLPFYRRADVVAIARELLGKYLLTRLGGAEVTGGLIVETEAYAGPEDRASHAHGNRRTARTETMFLEGGVAYVYLCYGIHCLLNVVTHSEGVPHAVLIRAMEPRIGVKTMMARRNRRVLDRRVAGGPGLLTEALGVGLECDGCRLTGARIWMEDRGNVVRPGDVLASERVGVQYAGQDAALPWRFRIRNSPWTSLPE